MLAFEQTRRRVVDAVLALAEPYRTALWLRFFEDLPPRKIGDRMGCPPRPRARGSAAAWIWCARALDQQYSGRGAWCLALVPLAAAAPMLGIGAGGRRHQSHLSNGHHGQHTDESWDRRGRRGRLRGRPSDDRAIRRRRTPTIPLSSRCADGVAIARPRAPRRSPRSNLAAPTLLAHRGRRLEAGRPRGEDQRSVRHRRRPFSLGRRQIPRRGSRRAAGAAGSRQLNFMSLLARTDPEGTVRFERILPGARLAPRRSLVRRVARGETGRAGRNHQGIFRRDSRSKYWW